MGEPIFLPQRYDIAIQKQYLDEHANLHLPLFGLRRLDRVRTIVDPVYNESPSRRWLDPVELRGYVDHKPSKKTLGKYGMDQERHVLFLVPTHKLSELGILEANDTFLIGDLVMWGGDAYEILNQNKDTEGYWANTNIPFYIAIGGDLYREGL